MGFDIKDFLGLKVYFTLFISRINAVFFLKKVASIRLIKLDKKTYGMKKIVLDTNFLINCVKYHIDPFSELERICNFQYKIYVLEQTIRELDKVKPKELGVIKQFISKMEVMKEEGTFVDDILVKLSSEGMIVGTQDQFLKKRLKKPLIVIRQKKYLTLVE